MKIFSIRPKKKMSWVLFGFHVNLRICKLPLTIAKSFSVMLRISILAVTSEIKTKLRFYYYQLNSWFVYDILVRLKFNDEE